MDEGLPSVSIFAFFIILLFDFFIHGFEMALDHASREEIDKKSGDEKDNIAKKLIAIIENRDRFNQSVHVFVVIINMILGTAVLPGFGGFFLRFFSSAGEIQRFLIYCLTGLFISVLIMSFGIIIPGRLAARNPERWLYACYYPAAVFASLFRPVVRFSEAISSGVLYIFGVRGDDRLLDVTEEEIKSMVNEGQEQGVIQESEADMITNIFEFSDKEAQDIMTNRNAMVAIDANSSLKEAVNFMMDTNNSRFPVYLEDIDHIIGIMHIRDAMKKLSENTDDELPIRKIKGLLRQPKFVPETRNIDSLFHSMQSSKTQMVIVIDEYGQTAGLVTMEDILEEIVGNIMDEYDEDENYIKPTRNPMEFTVDGRTPIEVLEKKYGISFGETPFETLNGYLISKLDRIPESDEKFDVTVEGHNFRILSVQNHMVQTALMTIMPSEADSEQEKEL